MKNIFAFVGLIFAASILPAGLPGQSVQPMIVEYQGRADGKITLTNNTASPLVVVLEPKSFSIDENGRGSFRHLDRGINVQLSRSSVRLEPRQSYYIFYKAFAEVLPAWFTIYSTFSNPQHGPGLDVRILLPHTVYLYQKSPIIESDVRIKDAVFSAKDKKLICNLENVGGSLARVKEVRANSSHYSADSAGFPLLPAEKRRVEMDWLDKSPPSEISFHFEHFTARHAVSMGGP
jgi:hypothetical protein